jgi:hypothetical protein
MMVVPPMQSISGDEDDDGTYVLHTCGLPHGQHAGFARPAMFGASATVEGVYYYFIVAILGFVCCHICNMHLRLLCPAFFDAEFCT